MIAPIPRPARVCENCHEGPREGRTVTLIFIESPTLPTHAHRWLCDVCTRQLRNQSGGVESGRIAYKLSAP
jgi:hypothetical protein